MRGSAVLAPAMLALCLGACDSIRGWQEPIEATAPLVAANTRDSSATLLVDYYKEQDAAKRRMIRDLAIDQRLIAINARFYHFEKELREAKVGTGFGGDIVKLVLGAVGAVTGTAMTKSIISAASGGVTGATASFDKHVFYETALPALIAQMHASRDRIISTIRERQKTDIGQFSLGEGFELLQRVEQAGSIDAAISQITEKATKDAKEANAGVLAVNRVAIVRTADDAAYMAAAEGRARVEKLLVAVDKLDPVVAQRLAMTPPTANVVNDAAVATEVKRANGNVSLALARRLLKFRIVNAAGSSELEKWEAAFK